MEKLIPSSGFLGKCFNPHSFNHKEHAAILIMATTAARCAEAAQVIAVQRLWYTELPNAAVCIFLIFSSQTLGYGMAGLLRKVLVYPTKVQPPFSHFVLKGTKILLYYLAEADFVTDKSSSTLQTCQLCLCSRRCTGRRRIQSRS